MSEDRPDYCLICDDFNSLAEEFAIEKFPGNIPGRSCSSYNVFNMMRIIEVLLYPYAQVLHFITILTIVYHLLL